MLQISYFLIFIFGLITGSFLNSVIFRLEKGEGFIFGRSRCPHCKQQLSWLELIPLASFFLLKGRCSRCGKKISWQYPLVELATGIIFVLVFYYTFPDFLFSIFYFLISWFLIVIFVYDLKHYIIPDVIVYATIALALIFNFNAPAVLSAFGAAVFFLAIVLISRGKWMGMGDVKLAFLMGLVLGIPNILVALFLAFILGAIIGLGLIFFGKKTLKSQVPFGPFLITGTFASLLWGSQIINWYLNLL